MLSRTVFSSCYSHNFLRRPYRSLISINARLKKVPLTYNSGGQSLELWSVACARQDRMLWKSFPTRLYSQNENENSIPIADRINKMLKNNKVVIFIKGVPDQPMCGFSNAVVQVLRMHGVADYDAHNVLEDEELRQGIKEYSDWPTIPQVYLDGEFLGGCDILLQMHQSGELIDELKKLGIKSAVLK